MCNIFLGQAKINMELILFYVYVYYSFFLLGQVSKWIIISRCEGNVSGRMFYKYGDIFSQVRHSQDLHHMQKGNLVFSPNSKFIINRASSARR